MSHDDAGKIALHFYTKLFNVVNDARATAELPERFKTDKWFNLDIPDPDLFPRDVRERYKAISSSPLPPPFEIQVLLCVPELASNQVIVQLTPNASRTRIEPTPRFILLESWRLTLAPKTPSDEEDLALPTIYKHAITLFRSLYSLLRLLPSWTLFKRIRRRTGGHNRNGNLSIKLRVRTGTEDDSDASLLGFGLPPSRTSPPFQTKSYAFTAIPHPMGTLAISTTYLINPNFQLDELESLLSSRFMAELDGPGFVPTLAKNQAQRSSLMTTGSSPGGTGLSGPGNAANAGVVSVSPVSAAGRAFPAQFHSKSKSPPESAVERFITPARTPSISSQDQPGPQQPSNSTDVYPPYQRSPRLAPLHIRHASNPTSYNPGPNTSAFPSKEDGPYSRPPSGLGLTRIRRESAGGVASGVTGYADTPGSPSASTISNPGGIGGIGSPTTPLPIRKPHLSSGVNPFKSNTLNSPSSYTFNSHSPSPRGSPLGGITTSVSSGGPIVTGRASPVPRTSTMPPSPIGMGMPLTRASPPFTPSSLGDRRSIASNEGEEGVTGARAVPTMRPRYSSSFGHRYISPASGSPASGTPGKPGSEGSTGSGGNGGTGVNAAVALAERREGVSSFISTNTDEDDISMFVQEIDSRKPLSGRHRILDEEKRRREASDDSVDAVPQEGGDTDLLFRLSRPEGVANEDTSNQATVRRLSKLPLGADLSREPQPQLQDRFVRLGLEPGNDESPPTRPLGPSGLAVVVGAAAAVSGSSTVSSIGTPTPTSVTPRTALGIVGSPGAVLTNHADIDEKLRRMNENFLSSLEGLGSGRVRSGSRGGNGGTSSLSGGGSGGGGGADEDGAGSEEALVGRRYPLGKPFAERRREISLSESGMGSQEVMGRMEVDYPRRS